MKKRLGLMLVLILSLAMLLTLTACPAADETPAEGTPSIPLDLSASVYLDKAVLTWSAPNSVGDSAIIRYEVQRDKSGGGVWINVGLATTYTFNDTKEGTTYTFKVRAVNSQGAGTVATIK